MPLKNPHRRLTIALAAALATSAGWPYPDALFAGMPSPTISDVPRYVSLTNITSERLQAISFFVVGFLVSVAFVKLLWNLLAKDFPRLPRLGYIRAFSLVSVWGLLFLLVLTMISGARELMTPGAWAKDGLTYKLAQTPRDRQVDRDEAASRAQLTRLFEKLKQFAGEHEGRFPADIPVAQFGSRGWLVPGPIGISYIYVGSRQLQDAAVPLVLEPNQIREPRLALWTDGSIRHQSTDDARQTLP